MPPPFPPPPTPDIILPLTDTLHSRATGSHWSTRLLQVTGRVGLLGARGALLAFADYNEDNFVDILLAAPPADASHYYYLTYLAHDRMTLQRR